MHRLLDFLALITLRRVLWRSDRMWTFRLMRTTPLRWIPYSLDTWALARSQYWSREKIVALQEYRIHALLTDSKRIPLWKRTLSLYTPHTDSAISFLETIPVCSRTTFKSLPTEEYCDVRLLPSSLLCNTSGSTGVPFSFYLDQGALMGMWALRERQYRSAAGGKRLPIVIFRADQRLKQRFFSCHFLYLRGFNDIPERFPALKELLLKHAPHGAVLNMFPSSAIALAKYVASHGEQIPVAVVAAVGESVSTSDRELIEQSLGARFVLSYSTSESATLAFECEHGNMHINEEDIFAEIVDDTGRRLPEGEEGRVVLTHLGYRVMPLTRYDNGDRGILSLEPCPCGRSLRTISVTGRTPMLITHESGYTVTLAELTSIFNEYGQSIELFQIVHSSPLRMTVKIIPGPLYASAAQRIEDRFRRKLHPEMHVIFETVTQIDPGRTGKRRNYVREFA